MSSSYRFVVTGRVQGVFFRQSTMETAQRLGIRGWVRNCADGTVEGLAEGRNPALHEFRKWLDQGPPRARVDQVQWVGSDAEELADGFEVRS
ncbi:MAG: acylphosphatase [Pseudomonadota bacterium]|nr:acylphosphatase [Pseudomonadota bacterium]